MNCTDEYQTIEYYKDGERVGINQAHPDIVPLLTEPVVAKGYAVKVYNPIGTLLYTLEPQMFYTIYYYDEDTGKLVGTQKATPQQYKATAAVLWAEGFPVKVYDEQNTLIYTLGI